MSRSGSCIQPVPFRGHNDTNPQKYSKANFFLESSRDFGANDAGRSTAPGCITCVRTDTPYVWRKKLEHQRSQWNSSLHLVSCKRQGGWVQCLRSSFVTLADRYRSLLYLAVCGATRTRRSSRSLVSPTICGLRASVARLKLVSISSYQSHSMPLTKTKAQSYSNGHSRGSG